jgi:hypothetical protein
MGRTRKCSRRLWLALLPLIAACHSYRPATLAPQGAEVRIRFSAPREVRGSFADARPVALQDVVAVEGLVTRMYGDTVELRLTGASNQSGSLPSHLYEGAQTTIVLEPRSVLETRGISKGKTAFAIGGGAAVLLAIAVIVVAVALASVLAGGY